MAVETSSPTPSLRPPFWAVASLLTFVASLALLIGFIFGKRQPVALPANRLIVTVLNVQQGEAAWVRTPGGKIILLGAGPPGQGGEVAASLRDAGVDTVDLLILPYPYAEAIGGLTDAVKNVTVVQALEPGGESVNQWQTQARNLLSQKKIPLRRARAGDVWQIDGVRIEILAPPEPPLTAPPVAANNSFALRLVYGDTRFLFAGGIEKAGETALLTRSADISAQWLRVAHLGTRQASSPEFLRLVSPEVAVISVGANPDGLPHQEALRRLAATGAKIYRTDAQIAPLRFISDGSVITLPPASPDAK